MKILLTKDVVQLGRSGQIVDVSDAYARNYLLAKRLGQVASNQAVAKQVAADRRRVQAADADQDARLEAERSLSSTTLELTAEANEQGTLFAAIKAPQIIQGLVRQSGLRLDGVIIEPKQFKNVGPHTVTLHWPQGPKIPFTIIIRHA